MYVCMYRVYLLNRMCMLYILYFNIMNAVGLGSIAEILDGHYYKYKISSYQYFLIGLKIIIFCAVYKENKYKSKLFTVDLIT